MVGVAVRVTELPIQNGLEVGEMETLTGRFGDTTVVIAFDGAGLFDVQTVLDDVRIH